MFGIQNCSPQPLSFIPQQHPKSCEMNFEDMHAHVRALFADGLSLRSRREEFTVENAAVKMEKVESRLFVHHRLLFFGVLQRGNDYL